MLGNAVRIEHTVFDEEDGACLDLGNIALKERLTKLAFTAYNKIRGESLTSAKNITAVEKKSYWSWMEHLEDARHGGGFKHMAHGTFIGDLYKISFSEVREEVSTAPTTHCHTFTILFAMPDMVTPMDHTERPCSEDRLNLNYEYGGLDIPDMEYDTLSLEDVLKREVKVMSYNVWNFEQKYEQRMEMIAQQIVAEGADVVSLQEVRWSNFEYPASEQKRGDSVHDLAVKLYKHGYKHWAWRPAMIYPQSAQQRTLEGLAVFSKFPITDVEGTALDRWASVSEDYHQRLLLRVEVETPFGVFNAFTSHFSLYTPARDHNCVLIRDTMVYYSKLGPVALMGDLNAELHESKGLQYLLGKHKFAASTGFLTDAYASLTDKVGPKDLKALVALKTRNWTYTTLQKAPKKIIDFFFYDARQSEVVDYRVIENTFADQKQQPSDHRPIVVTLRFKE